MQVTTPISDELVKYLDLATAQLKLTSQNMANVDTPGYRTVGFDFATEMRSAMEDALAHREPQAALAGEPATADSAANAGTVAIGKVDGLLERPDGNNVSMDREGLKMAEAQLEFRTGIALLKREYTRVLDAIRVDK